LAGIPAIWVMALAIAALIHPNVRSIAQARAIKSAAWRLGRGQGVGAFGVTLGESGEPTLEQVEMYAKDHPEKHAA
jgi:hypothetical protein